MLCLHTLRRKRVPQSNYRDVVRYVERSLEGRLMIICWHYVRKGLLNSWTHCCIHHVPLYHWWKPYGTALWRQNSLLWTRGGKMGGLDQHGMSLECSHRSKGHLSAVPAWLQISQSRTKLVHDNTPWMSGVKMVTNDTHQINNVRCTGPRAQLSYECRRRIRQSPRQNNEATVMKPCAHWQCTRATAESSNSTSRSAKGKC
jgi:hypothetical protein